MTNIIGTIISKSENGYIVTAKIVNANGFSVNRTAGAKTKKAAEAKAASMKIEYAVFDVAAELERVALVEYKRKLAERAALQS